MNLIQALLLGIIEVLTEYIPFSSTAHLLIAQRLPALPSDNAMFAFLVLVQLPAASGPLAFPAVQSCGATQKRWTEPAPASGERPKQPAPTITLTPSTRDAAAPHHH